MVMAQFWGAAAAAVVVVLPVNVAELSGKIIQVVTTFMYDEPGVSDMT